MKTETYLGVAIHHEPGEGFHASASCAVHFGYCDTLAEIREEIADHFAEEAAHYGDRDTPLDTPALDDSFHRHEMNLSGATFHAGGRFGG